MRTDKLLAAHLFDSMGHGTQDQTACWRRQSFERILGCMDDRPYYSDALNLQTNLMKAPAKEKSTAA
jgi:hypothetical protein